MSSLYELTGFYLQLAEMLDDPTTDQESFQDTMDAISDEIEVKADNYAKIIRNMEESIESIENELKRLTERKTSLKNNVKRMKDNLQDCMIATGKRKFKTDLFSFSIQKNGGVTPVIVDVPIGELPDSLVIVSEKPDLKAIAKWIEDYPNTQLAHFGERGESLRIK